MRLVGVDIGTSIVKAALFTGSGDLVATAARPVPLQHPAPGQVEQDPDQLLRALRDTLAELDLSTVDLVSITGQGDGCWLADESGTPVRSAISWMDARGAAPLAGWERDGVVDAIYRVAGNALFPGAQAAILRWLDEHEPASLDSASTAAYCKDLIFQRLTGMRATDPSDSSLPFGDGAGGYSQKVLDLCGLSHRAELLAPILAPVPTAVINGGGSEFGLAAGIPVTDGPFDLPACAAGGGVTEPGDGLLTIGTTLACQVLVDAVSTSGEPAGMHLATGTPGRWLRAMPAMVGTASLDWTLGLLGLTHEQLDPALAASPAGARGVTVLPYLAPSGERAPFVDPAARGQFDGLRLTTTGEDLIRALCEGLAYAARQCLEAAGLTGRLVVCGGGTRSLPWLQIFAGVLNRPLHVARSPEVGARGAVLRGLHATGHAVDTDAWTRPEREVEPEPGLVAQYEDGYRDYLRRQRNARTLWHS